MALVDAPLPGAADAGGCSERAVAALRSASAGCCAPPPPWGVAPLSPHPPPFARRVSPVDAPLPGAADAGGCSERAVAALRSASAGCCAPPPPWGVAPPSPHPPPFARRVSPVDAPLPGAADAGGRSERAVAALRSASAGCCAPPPPWGVAPPSPHPPPFAKLTRRGVTASPMLSSSSSSKSSAPGVGRGGRGVAPASLPPLRLLLTLLPRARPELWAPARGRARGALPPPPLPPAAPPLPP